MFMSSAGCSLIMKTNPRLYVYIRGYLSLLGDDSSVEFLLAYQ